MHARSRPGLRMSSLLLLLLVGCCRILPSVEGHGRLIEPPSRSSMWRFGFHTKPNYNDNELFCGGYTVQWQRNGGKCGVCGDAWHLPSPRPNEAGGIYGQGIITRTYKPGQVIESTVDITANHKGFFEFKLCPHNNPRTTVSQECLDSYPLQLADGSGSRYYPSAGTGHFRVQLVLPDHLTCSQCVFQWTYTAGNNWGRCEDGSSAVGCGPQETFRGCSDVSIGEAETNDIPIYNERPAEKPSISAIPTRRPTHKPRYRPSARPNRGPYYNNRGPPTSRRPYYNNDPIPTTSRPSYYNNMPVTKTTRKPYSRRPRPTRPSLSNNLPRRLHTTRRIPYPSRPTRPTPYRPIYTPRPTPYRPYHNKNTGTKKAWPGPKTKYPEQNTNNIEYETNNGGCRAVGVWKSIAGIPSWCNTNCARGYCPASHCDCS